MTYKRSPPLNPLSILRRREVEKCTKLSRSTIYRKAAEGSFPSPVQLGARAVGWIEAEVQGWLAEQVAVSRGDVAVQDE